MLFRRDSKRAEGVAFRRTWNHPGTVKRSRRGRFETREWRGGIKNEDEIFVDAFCGKFCGNDGGVFKRKRGSFRI